MCELCRMAESGDAEAVAYVARARWLIDRVTEVSKRCGLEGQVVADKGRNGCWRMAWLRPGQLPDDAEWQYGETFEQAGELVCAYMERDGAPVH